MTAQLLQKLRNDAILELALVEGGAVGLWASGEGRYKAFFSRDAFISIILALSKNQGDLTPRLVKAAIRCQKTAIKFEGKLLNDVSEEAPGKKPHEVHFAASPQDRLAMLRDNGWPVHLNDDGTLGMVYYGAGDANSLFTISVGVVARAIEKIDPDEALRYMRKMWPSIERGLKHDMMIADIDGDGLIESNPKNKKALLNHTWKDSNEAYIDEEGNLPPAPYKYLTNNCHFVWALKEASVIARKLGYPVWRELRLRHKTSKKKLVDTFWSDKLNFMLPLVDGRGRQLEIVTDDAADALWAKLLDREMAKIVARRLTRKDMLTPRGIRTRSSKSMQFAANGIGSYHNGLVWPHRTMILAQGAQRYGWRKLARDLNSRISLVLLEHGNIECVGVSKGGQKSYLYMENGVSAACKPQCWAVFGTLGFTAS
ncbi:MAG: hypothetical protein NUV69_01825 [Candidatus Curtissbacteria bacterium]|nr:hypothetical protein [Candidatus Curtissbacteria bacterium]